MLRTRLENADSATTSQIANAIAERLKPLHSLVIGPGLGRDECVQDTTHHIIRLARDMRLPLIIDGVRVSPAIGLASFVWLVYNRK